MKKGKGTTVRQRDGTTMKQRTVKTYAIMLLMACDKEDLSDSDFRKMCRIVAKELEYYGDWRRK